VSDSEKLTAQLTAVRERLAEVERELRQDSIELLDDPKARNRLAVLVVDKVALPYQIAELERRVIEARLGELREAYAAATSDLAAAGADLGPLVSEYRAIEQERRILINRLGSGAAEVLPLSERMQALQAQMAPIRARQASAQSRADVAVNEARELGVELR